MMKKINMIIKYSLVFIIPGVLYTYYYPWLYNIINSYTKRSEPLDDNIDLLNSIFIFVLNFFIYLSIAIIIAFIAKSKRK